MKNTLILILLLFSIFPSVNAQETGEDKLGSWFMFFSKHQVSKKFSVNAEVQYRTFEFGSNFNQLLLRTGLNYHFAKNATATIGYGYISTDGTFIEIDGEENSIENRIYEEFNLNNAIGKFKFGHRYRLEQRFINNPLTGNDTQHRMRYLLRITYPIANTWFLTAYDEVFINLQEPIFGQNRLYGAIGNHITKDISIQVGYLKNHFTGVNFDRFQIGIWWNTDLRKKSKENNGE